MTSLTIMNNIRFKNKYRIPSTRLQNWDYSSSGWYYVTICTKDRICYFGSITNRKINLSDIGKIAKQYWKEIPDHFNNIILEEYTIMPNHIHGIIIIQNNVETGHAPSLQIKNKHTLGNIIGSFKSASANEIHRKDHNFSWQSRFYDHIVRETQSLNKIRWYIQNNHLKWDEDEENPKNH